MEPNIIYRYGSPSKLDHASSGTECRILKDNDFDLYVQTSSNEEQPNWILLGCFNEESYVHYAMSLDKTD